MRRLLMIMIFSATTSIASIGGAQDQQGFLVVVHPDNPTQSLNYSEVSDMFLTKTTRWDDRTVVEPVDLPSGSSVRDSFSTAIHQKSVASVESYLHQQIFSGRAKPPLVVESDSEVAAFVSKNSGAIGYVSSDFDPIGVKVLSLVVPPVRIKFVQPRFTAAAKRAKAKGTVTLELTVDTNGDVVDVYPVSELGYGLTQAAINAAKQWKYQPGTEGGEPTEATIRVSVRFN